MDLDQIDQRHLCLGRIISSLLADWGQHRQFLKKSLESHTEEDIDLLECLAQDILTVAEDSLSSMIAGYRWMCEAFLEEELFFRREGRYRCTTIAEAEDYIYNDPIIMGHYMRGLLLSQLLWSNHAKVYLTFLKDFLPMLKADFEYLEIGSGHGIFLAHAARNPRGKRFSAWDISAESLHQTRNCLRKLSVDRPVELVQQNVAQAKVRASYDAIVLNEVLEHLENPRDVLSGLRDMLAPGGKIFIHFPINSPAPDHIFLVTSQAELRTLVESSGLVPCHERQFPMSGYSLERAIATQSTISCVVIAQGVQP